MAYLPCGGEIVLGFVEHFLAEDFARLLSNALTEVLIVDLDARDVALVAWDDGCLTLIWALHRK